MTDQEDNEFEGGLTVAEFCQRGKLGSTRLYELLKTGEIKALKNGRKTIIPVSEARKWWASLPAYGSAETA
jgi:excisionase family DNA binding protein